MVDEGAAGRGVVLFVLCGELKLAIGCVVRSCG